MPVMRRAAVSPARPILATPASLRRALACWCRHSCARLDSPPVNLMVSMLRRVSMKVDATRAPAESLSLPEHWAEIDALIFAGKKFDAMYAIREALKGQDSHWDRTPPEEVEAQEHS